MIGFIVVLGRVLLVDEGVAVEGVFLVSGGLLID